MYVYSIFSINNEFSVSKKSYKLMPRLVEVKIQNGNLVIEEDFVLELIIAECCPIQQFHCLK